MSETSQQSSENDGKSKQSRGSRKRQVHNEVERRRKDKINGWISKIAELLPIHEWQKQSKISILEHTVDYIKLLTSEKEKLLSENCLEVQVEEIRKLKKDLTIVKEQNVAYEKLLHQANISLNSLPKKTLKYSDEFVRKNGVLALKNNKCNGTTTADCAVQVNSDLIPNISGSNESESNITSKSTTRPSNAVNGKNSKNVGQSKVSSSTLKSNKTAVTSSLVLPIVPATVHSIQSDVNVAVTTSKQSFCQGNRISQENIIPIINWNDPVRNSAALHAGGVTTVLSQFPVMSTSHSSTFANVCQKNMPTIIIPAGGSILQPYSHPEKSSNTISIICPSTLPIFVPQQVLNVSSMARNVGVASALICPAPVNTSVSQTETSALSSTLVTLNPSSIVPISSNIAANAQIILPSQSSEIANTCSNGNVSQSISLINSTLQTTSDQLSVPSIEQKATISEGISSQFSETASSTTSESKLHSKNKDVLNSVVKESNPVLQTNALESRNDKDLLSSPSDVSLNSPCKQTLEKEGTQNENIKSSPCKEKRSITLNSLPSLQVLSANKIISLASRTQKLRPNLILPLYQKSSDEATSVSLQTTKSQNANNFCLQIDSPCVSKLAPNDQDKTTIADQVSSSSMPSKFSLTVLMGNDSPNKNMHVTQNEKLSDQSSGDMTVHTSTELPLGKSSAAVENTASSSHSGSAENLSLTFPAANNLTELPKLKENLDTSNFSKIPNGNNNLNVQKSCNCKSSSPDITASEKSLSSNVTNITALTLDIPKTDLLCTNISTDFSTSTNVQSKHRGNPENNFMNQNELTLLPYSKENSSSVKTGISQSNPQPSSNSENQQNTNVSVEMNVFSENISYIVDEKEVHQNILPTLFANTQIAPHHSSVYMCSSAHESTSNNANSINETTSMNSCLLPDSCADLYNFQSLNKEITISNSYSAASELNSIQKRSDESHNELPRSSVGKEILNVDSKNAMKNNKLCNLNSCPKQNANKKKKIPNAKTLKTSSTDVKLNSSADDITDAPTSVNKTTANRNDNSYIKINTSNCFQQEQNTFIFTSDILARATESIFGNDMLGSPQLSKKSNCYSDDSSNPNISNSEKSEEHTYKLQYSGENIVVQTSVASEQKEKKISNLDEIQIHGMDDASANVGNLHDPIHKPGKISRSRKAKSVGDIEPPYKRVKDMLVTSSKPTDVHIFQQIHQEKREEKQSSVNMHLNDSTTSKQISPEMHASENNQTNSDSAEHFANQIHLSDNSCKTPIVDNIFSLTPMLGDILKDVSHNNNLEPRSAGFLSCNDSQNIFQTEKNFMSFNYSSTANEDYMNLPRMYFPIIPEISAASVVQVTNVSYAHSVSLCSTQSDSMKTTETISASEAQNKTELKKQPILQENQNALNCDLTSNMSKHSECVLKLSDSEPQFTNASSKLSNSSLLFEGQNSEVHTQSLGHTNRAINSKITQNNSNYISRDTFVPTVSHNITFYPTISSSSTSVQNFPSVSSSIQNFTSNSPTVLPHSNFVCSNSLSLTTLSFPIQVSNTPSSTNTFSSQSTSSKSDSLSHSLCSLLKENTNVLVDNRSGVSGSNTVQNVSTSTNTIQSKYSALSLISDQTSYSDSVSSATCHPDYPQTSLIYTPTSSETHYTSTASNCGRNQRTSLSYSAESLLQTSCANSEKNKSKFSNRYQQRVTDKKSDRIANIHNITDTNIFMPVSNCDLNIQNVPLVPLPPVTTFQNFSSSYTLCDTIPSTTIFNTATRTHDIPLSHSNDNFLNHVNLSVESQMLNNRHENTAVPKPHSNIPLPFENHGSLYSSCNFLPHVKPTIESSGSAESSTCFQPGSFNNNYSQQSQKPNCCHFPHRTLSGNSELTTDISLPIAGTSVASFHAEKGSYQAKRPALQSSFSQSNSNFVGNFFYNPTTNVHDGNDLTSKLPNLRPSQEAFAPDAIRQNINDSNSGIIFNNRKNITSNRSKSKKGKNINPNENNLNLIPNSMGNFCSTQESSCNKVNLPCVSNGYFKNNSHAVIASQNQLSCPQTKLSESTSTSVMPSNPPFNPLLHQQGDNFLSLNFQPPNFAVSPLSRAPTQPLSCSCLTTPIISHTFSSTAHPVPNFNLSNILPDMSCSGSQVSLSPVKFPTMNHSLPSSTTQCQTNSNISNSAHIVSHQSCTPSLYPPHPPIVRSTLNPIIGHNSQSLNENQVSLVGTGGPVPQNTFSATQSPTFRNVIHSLPFPRTNR